MISDVINTERNLNVENYIRQFKCYSANDVYPELWFKSIGLIFDQFSELVKKNGFDLKITEVDDYQSQNDYSFGMTFQNYGSDKFSHKYHIIYNYIFNKINIQNLLEIGLGTNNVNIVSNIGQYGKPGASLRAFKELQPLAQIYGADVDKDILFWEERITTFYVDQLDRNSLESLPKIKYDLIIDDGLHQIGANFNTLLWALENLNDGGYIVIEDITLIDPWMTIAYILSQNSIYDCSLVKCARSYLFIVNKKN